MPFRVIAPDEKIEERLEPMQCYRIHAKCPDCDGELRGTGLGVSNNRGTSWQNRCTKCDFETSLPHSYPYIGYRSVSASARGDADSSDEVV